MADFTIKQGDTRPALTDTLTYSDGTSPNLAGATVLFIARQLTAASPAINATATITNPTSPATVSYTFSTADTSVAGQYMAYWQVTFADTSQMVFPTTGYLQVSIEENLVTAGGAQLVGLGDVKDYLTISSTDRSHDAKLIRFITALQPIVENISGPIMLTQREEWHDGGQHFIRLRRRPSSGFGTSPVQNLIAVSEYRGPIEYTLKIVQDPAHGDIYSCMLDNYGFVTRRTTGGGVIAFPQMPRSVHVIYQAGQSSVPGNVYEGTLELIRLNYQRTQQGIRLGIAGGDQDDMLGAGPPLGFFVPGRVRELLSPSRRAPSVA